MKKEQIHTQSTLEGGLLTEALEKLKAGEPLEGENGVLAPLIKRLIEAALAGEANAHVSDSRPNRLNGATKKRLKTSYGPVDIETPRDRDGTFDPQLVRKRQMTLGSSIDRKILSLYSMGMSYRDIEEYIKEMYGMELSPALMSSITDQVIGEVQSWRQRPLEKLYSCVWLDAIYFRVREDGQVVQKAVYTLIGVNLEGVKDVLGFYIGAHESAKFWMQVLDDLRTRGVERILIACIDNLTGFKEAIRSIYPKTDIQQCLVHQMRNSLQYVPYKHQKEVAGDLKAIYKASNREAAEVVLEEVEKKYKNRYKPMVDSWYRNWTELSQMFNYPLPLRRMIYTTNSIEGFHRQLRKVTKTKGSFSSDQALSKLLFLVIRRITGKWTRSYHNWTEILTSLTIYYEDDIVNRVKGSGD